MPGTIPAHAGEPHDFHDHAAIGKDYPRACGGTDLSALVFPFCLGLSPRMRGNRASLRP